MAFIFSIGLPTIFHIFAHNVPMEERSRAFGYLVAAGSVGQTVASVVSHLHDCVYAIALFTNTYFYASMSFTLCQPVAVCVCMSQTRDVSCCVCCVGSYCSLMGHSVAQLVEALCYKPKVTGSIPDGVTGIFIDNPSSCTMALGLTQPLTEMSTRIFPGG
jgi:hypothetical protein